MRRLLITGASGFLGWNVARVARHDWRVFGTYYTTKKRIVQEYFVPIEMGRIDLTEFRDMREMMALIEPDAVIHTAALSDPNYCETHPDESFRINVEATRNLAGLCADREIPFVFTSTDLVFDGESPPYAEDDKAAPVNVYGEHKALAEMESLDRYPLASICRMPLMFGAPSPRVSSGRGSFLQWMLPRLRSGETLPLFNDEYRTPVSAEVAAQGLLMVARSGLPEAEEEGRSWIAGRLHLGGRERLSRYEFGRLVQDVLGLETARLEPVSVHSVPMPAQRPPDVSLDSSKAYALGYDPPPLRAQLEQLFGRRHGERGSGTRDQG